MDQIDTLGPVPQHLGVGASADGLVLKVAMEGPPTRRSRIASGAGWAGIVLFTLLASLGGTEIIDPHPVILGLAVLGFVAFMAGTLVALQARWATNITVRATSVTVGRHTLSYDEILSISSSVRPKSGRSSGDNYELHITTHRGELAWRLVLLFEKRKILAWIVQAIQLAHRRHDAASAADIPPALRAIQQALQ